MQRVVTKEFLIFWWHFYSSKTYNLDDLGFFVKIVEKHGPDKVFNAVVMHQILKGRADSDYFIDVSARNALDKYVEFAMKECDAYKRKSMQNRVLYIKFYIRIYDAIYEDFKKYGGGTLYAENRRQDNITS